MLPAEIATLSADVAEQADQLLHDVCLRSPLGGDLNRVRSDLQILFHGAPDIYVQPFTCGGGLQGLTVFDGGLVNEELLVLGVLDRLAASALAPEDGTCADLLLRVSRTIAPTGKASGAEATMDEPQPLRQIVQKVLHGEVVLCFAGCRRALSVKIQQQDKRAISEAQSAATVIGPRDGFIEDASTNLSLIRRRLRTSDLWVEQFHIGTLTQTPVLLLHLRGVADEALVREVRRRLRRIRIDGVLESNYIREMMRDAPLSIVPTMQRTERPDVVAAALLEGRVAIVVGGTPFALLAPVTLAHMMQVHADYYESWLTAVPIRAIRWLALLIGVFLPAVFVAITSYQHELVPLPLMTTLAASRENVPLPTFAEVLLLMVLFEVIREAGVRIPSGIGQALTIGGTLVVGQAAVRAGIVSSPIIIVTSAVVIAFFAIPDYDLLQVARFVLYPLILAASILGVFGLTIATFALMIHLASVRSFGVNFLTPIAPLHPRDWRDFVIRAPWWRMNRRPGSTGYQHPVRPAMADASRLPEAQ